MGQASITLPSSMQAAMFWVPEVTAHVRNGMPVADPVNIDEPRALSLAAFAAEGHFDTVVRSAELKSVSVDRIGHLRPQVCWNDCQEVNGQSSNR